VHTKGNTRRIKKYYEWVHNPFLGFSVSQPTQEQLTKEMKNMEKDTI